MAIWLLHTVMEPKLSAESILYSGMTGEEILKLWTNKHPDVQRRYEKLVKGQENHKLPQEQLVQGSGKAHPQPQDREIELEADHKT